MKRDDNRIGHFTSEKGKEDFQIAYDESMALLPTPNDTKDIKTKYGTAQFVLITLLKRKTNIRSQYSYSLDVVHLLQCGYPI